MAWIRNARQFGHVSAGHCSEFGESRENAALWLVLRQLEMLSPEVGLNPTAGPMLLVGIFFCG